MARQRMVNPKDSLIRLKTIWANEGIDAAMTVCQRLGFKRYDAWRLIETWMFPDKTTLSVLQRLQDVLGPAKDSEGQKLRDFIEHKITELSP